MPLQSAFQRLRWSSRVIVGAAVIANLAVSVATLHVTTVAAIDLVPHLRGHGDLALSRGILGGSAGRQEGSEVKPVT